MKTALGVLAALLFTSSAFAQTARNAIYGELGGNGLVLSFNYERRFTETFAWRAGFAYIGTEDSDGDDDWAITAPLMINYISRPQANHHFETGLGIVVIAGEGSDFWSDVDEEFSGAAGTATIGYRYQKPEGGFVFRAGLTPIFDLENIGPWAGVSFGYAW
jgi:hypothetical protein